MQSVLQYRGFRRNLEQQISRHGLERVASSTIHPVPPAARLPVLQRSLTRGSRRSAASIKDHATEEDQLQNETPVLNPNSGNADECGPNGPEPASPRGEVDATTVVYDHAASGSTLQDDAVDAKDGDHVTGSPKTPSLRSSASSESRRERTHLTTIATHPSQGTMSLGQAMTGVDVHTPMTNEKGHGTGDHVFVVGYQGPDDELDPHNWSTPRRLCYTLLIAKVGLIVGFASSVDSAAAPQAAEEFGVSSVVESMATAMYLLGFGLGAPFAAPLSETFGRNPVYIGTMTLFMVFVMASALAPNIGAQLVFRLFAGLFGSTPLTCAGGSISDMWNAIERTAMFPVFANAAFWGPILGPVFGGFIAQSSAVSWRWVEWVTLIWSGLILILLLLFLPETYTPTLLKWKAASLREITGDDRFMSQMEVANTKLSDRVIANMWRPVLLFAYEPIAVLFTLYLTVVYVVLFTFLTGFEFVFEQTYGLSQGLTFLIFVAIGVGLCVASAVVPWVYKSYRRSLEEVQAQGGSTLPPERRLIFAMLSAPMLPIGLFWMGWTAYGGVNIWAPIMSCIPIGFAILGIFISTYQYLIDAYVAHAASALVGVTFVRYIVAAGMIPASIPFYRNLGVQWTCTILGCISLLLAPVPFVFYKYGPAIRKRSRYASEHG